MSDTVDAVAQAICDATGRDHWPPPSVRGRNHYRRQALAAIDALGLAEEWRCIGWVITRDEEAAWKQHAANGGEVQTRLVSPWVREETTDG